MMYAIATVDRLKQAGSILFAILLFAIVLSGPASSQESFGFTEHAILYDNWCTVRNPVVIGNYTYVPSSTHLRVLDTSDPTQMQDAFETPDEFRFPCDFLALVDDYLWCFNGTRDDGKIRVVNVENPEAPYLLITHDIELREIFQVEQQGTLVFLATELGFMEVVDISNPLAPEICVDLCNGYYNFFGMEVYENYMYVAQRPTYDALYRVDILNMDNEESDLQYVSTLLDTLGNHMTIRVAVINSYLLTQINTIIRLYDLSESPETPELLDSLQIADVGTLQDALILGNKLYLAAGRLFVVDITDSTNLVLEHDYTQLNPMWLMADSSGQYLMLNSYDHNTIVNVSSLNDGDPDVLHEHVVQPSAVDIEIDYPFVYLLFADSLVVYDMSDLDNVAHVTTLAPDAELTCLDVQEEYLLLGDDDYRTWFYYIHDPSTPQFMTILPGTQPYHLQAYIHDDLLYYINPGYQLTIYDLSTFMLYGEIVPLGSSVEGWLYGGQNVFHIIEGQETVLAMTCKDGISRWVTVDVTDPTAPVFLHSEDFNPYLSHPEAAYFVGDTLNIISLDRHWGRIDFSDPHSPELIDNFEFRDYTPFQAWPLYALYQEPFWLMSIYDNEPLMVVRRNGEDAIPPLECVEQFGRSRKFDICNDALGYVDYVAVHLYSAKEAGEVKEELAIELPDTPELAEPYPNPFNPSVTIPFTLPEAGEVEIAVFNLLGQQVTTLTHTHFTVGRHSLVWDASANGFEAPSGVYFVRMKAGGRVQTRKVMLLK